MFAVTSRPTVIPQPHAAHATGPAPEAGVRRLRVSRIAARSHRARRGTSVVAARRPDTYLVRVDRPTPPAPVVRIRVSAPHRGAAAA